MTKIKCLKCSDIIESDGKGKWVACKCGDCYIDETDYYCRVGGNFKDYEVFDGDNWVNGEEYIERRSLNVQEEKNKDN